MNQRHGLNGAEIAGLVHGLSLKAKLVELQRYFQYQKSAHPPAQNCE